MSFDPRKSHLDDHDPNWDQLDEQDLPGDLADLAAQLSEDADHLASSYPATQSDLWLASATTDETETKTASTWHRWYRIAAAVAAISLTAGAGTWMINSRTAPVEDTAQVQPVAGQSQALHDSHSNVTEVAPMESPVVPAGFFQTLSGPEQEAMLDLMEEEGLDQPSLSI